MFKTRVDIWPSDMTKCDVYASDDDIWIYLSINYIPTFHTKVAFYAPFCLGSFRFCPNSSVILCWTDEKLKNIMISKISKCVASMIWTEHLKSTTKTKPKPFEYFFCMWYKANNVNLVWVLDFTITVPVIPSVWWIFLIMSRVIMKSKSTYNVRITKTPKQLWHVENVIYIYHKLWHIFSSPISTEFCVLGRS